MTKTETARLLTLIAAFDRRTIGETDVEAWHLIVGHLDTDDCAQAVREHFTTSRDWLMPADIHRLASDIAHRRAGQARLAQLEQTIAAENPPDQLHDRPVAALTIGQPVPHPADLMRREVNQRRRAATEADLAARAATQARREQARRELEQVRAATQSAGATPDAATRGRV